MLIEKDDNTNSTQETLKEIRKRNENRKIESQFQHNTQHPTNIDKTLRGLKSREPTSDNEFFRMNIIIYELGDLARAIVYAERFRNSNKVMFRNGFKDKNIILAEGKLAMADLLTQLHMLCISMGGWTEV